MKFLNDFFPLFANIFAIAGFVATTLAVYRLRDMQNKDRDKTLANILILVGLMFLVMRTLELPTLYETTQNGIYEIPPTTSIRVALQGIWYWLIYRSLFHLAKEQIKVQL